MKKTSEALESEPTIADMVLSFVTMHLSNDRFGTATKGLYENYLKAAPGALSHPKSNNLKFVCTAALGKDEGRKLYRCITSARNSNKKSIDAAWKLRMKDMPYDMVKWISDLHDKVELFEEDLKLLKEKVAALALRVDDHEGRLAALENRVKDREEGRPAPSVHPPSTPQGSTRHVEFLGDQKSERRKYDLTMHVIYGGVHRESHVVQACYYTVTYNHVIRKARTLVSEHKTFGLLPIESLKMGCSKGAVDEESIGDMTIREHYFSEDTEKFMSISSVYPVIVRFVKDKANEGAGSLADPLVVEESGAVVEEEEEEEEEGERNEEEKQKDATAEQPPATQSMPRSTEEGPLAAEGGTGGAMIESPNRAEEEGMPQQPSEEVTKAVEMAVQVSTGEEEEMASSDKEEVEDDEESGVDEEAFKDDEEEAAPRLDQAEAMLTQMGFEAKAIAAAMQQSDGDATMALERLLAEAPSDKIEKSEFEGSAMVEAQTATLAYSGEAHKAEEIEEEDGEVNVQTNVKAKKLKNYNNYVEMGFDKDLALKAATMDLEHPDALSYFMDTSKEDQLKKWQEYQETVELGRKAQLSYRVSKKRAR